jgi:hypothetical protein
MFKFRNAKLNFTQSFGFNLNYYKGHLEKQLQMKDGSPVDEKNLTGF